ncbi:3-beta hydroxysteroid dehydrogenase/isomerase family domain-containing protein [Trichoderma breve]|uniref:3-beta hydroxysteroid dehydrogenase/isomerase family domain-containing protein n=1 Tax=Trichoderma breve TaxID=2034170 RepID=A0A9W9E2E0_9HYPO|nr:3-beta hydroxysteroid dehydrogenase/isomerase family domain-containing protein [Trichoderma breve]KAJ4854165.1 3-beta hydroxysteroid dehydrogenase/isomerase family domain-containing protein [Trichoderma breve]
MVSTVLVTGGSGFAAAHVIRAFLNKGYNVKATVRSETRGEEVLESHAEHSAKLSYVIVPDIAEKGAFNDALQGVDGVIHVASPMQLGTTDFETQLFRPAVDGTVNLLETIQNSDANISRVVITSSISSILDPLQGQRPGYVYTEKDFSPVTKEAAIESGNAILAYLTSKSVSENAAFDYVEKHKPKFTISALCPPFIYGPLIHHVGSTKELNTSSNDIYRLFNGSEQEVPPTAFFSYVDVRDLAEAHVQAFEKPAAANQRYLIAASAYSYQQICDIIRAKFPELRETTPKGETGAPIPPSYLVDTTKANTDLGVKYRTLEDTIVDAVNSLRKIEKA